MSQEYKQVWRFYVPRDSSPSGSHSRVQLSEDESHLASQVLRLKEGEIVELADGCGWTARGPIVSMRKKSVEILIHSEFFADKRQFGRFAIVGLPKPGALDEVVQACVESGIDLLVFFRGERSTSKQDFKTEKLRKQVAELTRITKSPWNLEVVLSDNLSSAVERCIQISGSEVLELFVCDERPIHSEFQTGSRHLLECLKNSKNRSWACVVGPEASFSQHEYDYLADHATQRAIEFVSLGPRILRTPAAVAAATCLMAASAESN